MIIQILFHTSVPFYCIQLTSESS